MHIAFDVSGYYDWERADLHPGVQITPADVKALRAKQDANGNWLIRVEVSKESVHGAHIPETQLCYFMVWQAVHAGNEYSRHDAACELMKHSYKHHGRNDHIQDAQIVHDGGPDTDIIDSTIERCLTDYRAQLQEEGQDASQVDATVAGAAKIAAGVRARYLDTRVKMHDHVRSHFAPHAAHKKGV